MTDSNPKSYFDLHITGLGYLNRIRDVKPKHAEAFLACDIAALSGPGDDISYVRFDTKVVGSDAQHLVRRCDDAVKAKRKVLVGFRLGDLWSDIFHIKSGENAGKPCVSLKARLLFISWIKIDGVLKYKAETEDSRRDTAQPPSEPAREEAPPQTTEAETPATTSTSVDQAAGTQAPAMEEDRPF
ncbi:STY4534 family ICE replication protein [Acidovorax sp. NCPPB 3576]|uniref:STY4534 family ICE replication protein n=1 Tax=Acidovorax sp. NCPPB 3576 TaxID=2940488 RepID=UPI002349923A|nr:STY4534 family ICE replication protein [Acidovorax sp. NCPPB 3576]WCM86831.1 STY4534 family ICE replication protein [Acidovorax sp. NCPPB 3576]